MNAPTTTAGVGPDPDEPIDERRTAGDASGEVPESIVDSGSVGWLEELLAEAGALVGLVEVGGTLVELAPRPWGEDVATLGELMHPDDRPALDRALETAGRAAEGDSVTMGCRMRSRRGAWSEGAITFTRLPGRQQVLGIAFEPSSTRSRPGIGRSRPASAADTALQVRSDSLTGLPGREHMVHELAVLLKSAGKNAQVLVAVVDLDHFRLLNGSMGPDAADTVLLRSAERLRDLARPDAIVARLGADEFGFAFAGVDDIASAGRMARRLLQVLAAPVAVGAEEVSVTASIGVAIVDDPATDPAHLLRDADSAQWQARRRGGGRYEFFTPDPEATLAPRGGVVGRLHRSIDRSELTLVYQPVADLVTGQFVDAEALIRWQHPDYGQLLPAEFIPAAEQTGFIVELGTWAIEKVCVEIARWTRVSESTSPKGTLPRATVNVSTLQIGRPGFAAIVRDAIHAAGLAPEQLGLEITESALMADLDGSGDTLWQLRADGVRILADDFGTGYSSLAYLSRLPLDALKVDRMFIAELDRGTASAVLVKGIVELARSLGIAVIAEGVETVDQLKALRSMECDLAQGYLLAYPAGGDEVGPLFGTTPPALHGRRAS